MDSGLLPLPTWGIRYSSRGLPGPDGTAGVWGAAGARSVSPSPVSTSCWPTVVDVNRKVLSVLGSAVLERETKRPARSHKSSCSGDLSGP